MNILHIGLLSHFTEGMLYQDNILSDMNAKAGHNVVFVTDANEYVHGTLTHTKEQDKKLSNGVRLVRFNYDFVVNNFITQKIQKVHKLLSLIEAFRPDAIIYHGVCGYELMDVAYYVKKHPETTFYVDSHEDFNNTARNMISKMAYKIIHGRYIRRALPYVDKILYITKETELFLKDMYDIPNKLLEFYPLGGVIQTIEHQRLCRKKLIQDLNLSEDTIIFSHSGKLDKSKKTKEILEAFKKVKDNRFALVIFGKIPAEEYRELNPLIQNDERVHFIGWKAGQDIIDVLSGVDVYLQPGTQSATSQLALCCGCAEMVAPHPSYTEFYGNAVDYANNKEEIYNYFLKIHKNTNYICEYKKRAYEFALSNLDYSKLAMRYLEKNHRCSN